MTFRYRCVLIGLLVSAAFSTGSAQSTIEPLISLEFVEFDPPPDSLFVVDQVIILGNEKTKDYVILREMQLTSGQFISKEAMQFDASRIYSLGLFNRVQLGYLPTRVLKAHLVVFVHERWFIFPYPVFGIKDRDPKKLYFGAGVAHENFRGRNEKLYGMFSLGYDPAVIVGYRNPMIDAKRNNFLETQVTWRVVENRSVLSKVDGQSFKERYLFGSVSGGRRFGTAHTAWVSTSYQVVRVSEYAEGRTISTDGKDHFPSLGVGHVYNTRDAGDYALSGTWVRSTITKYGIPGKDLDFVRYAFDGRRYIPILPDHITLAGRLFGDFAAGGRIPTYHRRYLGYDQRVRGHFHRVFEGEQQLGASAELRFMLWGPKYVSIDIVPVPQFAVWKLGLAAAIFADAGTVWFRRTPLALDRTIRGYGAGLHFLLPYDIVVRTEYALNEVRKGEFILDFSAAF